MDDDERASVDNSPWDGAAAMSACANAGNPATAYAAVCAGRRAGDPALQSSWALPHHQRPGGPPNAAGVRNSLSRLPQTQGLTNREAAQRHLEAHMSTIQQAASARPPRDMLVRALVGERIDTSRVDAATGMPTLAGHFAVFNRWTEISSVFEGNFMERIAPGAFNYVFRTNPASIKVLFQHGKDPQIGDKLLGIPSVLEEDDRGARYEVPLFDTSYNRDLVPALAAGAYGASFRFSVMKEELDLKPKASADNPKGLPERTIQEAWTYEFGPVTFPAYEDATAGLRMRSMTDEYLAALLPHGYAYDVAVSARPAGSQSQVLTSGSVTSPGAAVPAAPRFKSREEYLAWLTKP